MDSPPASWQEVWSHLRSRPLRKAAGAAALLASGAVLVQGMCRLWENRESLAEPVRERDRKVMEAVLWRKPQ